MKFNQIYTLNKVKDWAIYARAKDILADDSGMSENEAIRIAMKEEEIDFDLAMEHIRLGEWDKIDAVTIHDDDTYDMEDDFYTDAHMGEIMDALDEALREAREDTY